MFEVNICPLKFNISKFICCKKNADDENRITDADFKLVKRKQRRYKNLIPYDGKFIYIKLLFNGDILCYKDGDDLLKKLGIDEEKLKKNIHELEITYVLFREYIGPVFQQCLKDRQIYQFDFIATKVDYSCCVYPCPMPNNGISVDVVIRHSQHITSDEIKDFVLRPFSSSSNNSETSDDSIVFKDAKSTTL